MVIMEDLPPSADTIKVALKVLALMNSLYDNASDENKKFIKMILEMAK
jgi:hypothetical protein